MSAIEQFHGIKTADHLRVYRVLVGPPPAGFPDGTFWPVNAEVPAGMIRTGWHEIPVDGVVQPILEPIPDPETSVPAAVSRRQLKEQLIVEGLDETVAAILAAMPGADGKIARNWYAEAMEFERAHPLVAALAAVIWPSPAHNDTFRAAQLDRIWTAAGAR